MIEFVDQEAAYTAAAEFVQLANQSDHDKVESWFKLLEVAEQVGPASNVGVRGISWVIRRGSSGRADRYIYALRAACVDGKFQHQLAAPETLSKARAVENLTKAQTKLTELCVKYGGLDPRYTKDFHNGSRHALVQAVGQTAAGAEWLAAKVDPGQRLGTMCRVAQTYGREGVYPSASLGAHAAFLTFTEREALVRAFPTANAARAKVMSLRADKDDVLDAPKHSIPNSTVGQLATRAGVSRAEARMFLRARLDGRSLQRLIRAAKMADEMVAGMKNDNEAKEAA